MNTSFGPFAVAVACLAGAAGSARADVIVVDPHGGPGEAVLYAALQSAHEGDILLLEAGDYSTGLGQYIFFDLSHTGHLTIVADAGAGPIVLRGLDLDLGAEPQPPFQPGTTLLRGVEIRSPAGEIITAPSQGTLTLNGGYNQQGVGGVWVEDCKLLGRDGFGPADYHPPAPATWLLKSQAVFTHCELQGGAGASDLPGGVGDANSGSPAMEILTHSNVTLADCIVRGGRAGDGAGFAMFVYGGDAVAIVVGSVWSHFSNLWVSGSQLTGGDDGAGGSLIAQPGAGLISNSSDPADRVYLRDSTVHAGHVVGEGEPAPDISVPEPCLHILPAAARSCSLPAPLRSGEPAALAIKGRPGDTVLLIASPASMSFKMKPMLQGVVDFAAWDSFAAPPFAIVDPSGLLTVPFTLPRLPVEFGGGVTLYIQGVFAGSDGLTLGAPTSLVWLDAGI